MKDISTTEVCPRDDIADYVDGELPPELAAELEAHIGGCAVCGRSLAEQRQFLAALSASLDGEELPELPEDFTRKIIVTAESSVTGLRRPNELFTAIFICAALLLFAMFAIGHEAFSLTSAAVGVMEKLLAAGMFVLNLLLSIAFAAAVIVRGIVSQFGGSGTEQIAIVFCGVFALALSTRWAVSRRNA